LRIASGDFCRRADRGLVPLGLGVGIELAAMLHTAATIPTMTFAGDAHDHFLTDDIIQGGLVDGRLNTRGSPMMKPENQLPHNRVSPVARKRPATRG